MKARSDLGLILFMALTAPLAAGIPETGTTLLGGGIDTPNRIQLVIVGDGWEEAHLPKFREAADKLVENLFKHSPYKEYKHCFSVTRVDVTSNVSGTNRLRDVLADPTNVVLKTLPYFSMLKAIEAPPGPGFQPDTNPGHVFRAAATLPPALSSWQGKLVMNGEHAVAGNTAKAEEAIKNTLKGKRKDLVIIMVHDEQVVNGVATFTGTADPLYTYIGYDWDYGRDNDPANIQGWNENQLWGSPEVLAHEIGHGLWDLKDEYGGNAGPATAASFLSNQVENGEIKSVNVSLKAEGKDSWKRWKDAGLVAGPIVGGATFNAGVWRAEQMCKMNVHHGSRWDPADQSWGDENPGGVNGTHPFAPVCMERAVQQIYGRVSLIDKAVPAEHIVEADDSSHFQSPAGQNVIRVETLGSSDRKITAEWYLDGKKVGDSDGLTRTDTDKGPVFEYRIDPAKIPPGYHFVFFMTQDRSNVGGGPEDNPVAILPPFFRFWLIHVEAPNIIVRLMRKMGWGDE